MSRQVDPFDRISMVFSALLHAAVLIVGWASTLYERHEVEFVTYEIELVSALPVREAEELSPAREEIVIERPDPEPAPPEPEVEEIVPLEDLEPDPPPTEREDPVVETLPEVAEEAMVATSVDPPEEESKETGEGLNVRMEGLRRDYPEYYDNIIRQIFRCFRWRDGGNWQTTVFFNIGRDGTATDIAFVSRSGNAAFDFEAMGAVDCAGQGRFGALPDDLPYDSFPVRFSFQPGGEAIALNPDVEQPTEMMHQR